MARSTKLVWMKVGDLKVHPTAQRLHSKGKVARLMRSLNLEAIGTVQAVDYMIAGVSGPWVVDGQHRVLALLEAGHADLRIPVEVHINVTTDQAASELFLLLNDRTVVAAYDKYLNGVTMGDPIWVGVKKAIADAGLRTQRSGGRSGVIACVNECYSIWKIDEGETLQRTLNISASAWGQTGEATEGKILLGLAKVIDTYNGQIDVPALIKSLAKYPGGAAGIIGDAKGRKRSRPGTTMSECIKDVVTDTYNAKRRSGKLARQ